MDMVSVRRKAFLSPLQLHSQLHSHPMETCWRQRAGYQGVWRGAIEAGAVGSCAMGKAPGNSSLAQLNPGKSRAASIAVVTEIFKVIEML